MCINNFHKIMFIKLHYILYINILVISLHILYKLNILKLNQTEDNVQYTITLTGS